jgi:hypothetical protein
MSQEATKPEAPVTHTLPLLELTILSNCVKLRLDANLPSHISTSKNSLEKDDQEWCIT